MRTARSLMAALALAGSALVSVPAAEALELVFWHHTYPPAKDFIEKKAAEYTAAHPDVTIKLHEEPHGDYEVKLLATIAAGNPPDIVNLLDYLFPQYVSKGILAEIDPAAFGAKSIAEVQDLFMPAALSGLTIDGKVYGVPEEFNTLALFLNKQHFTDVGLDATDPANWPKTWNDLFALAGKLQQKDGAGNVTRLGFNWVWNLDPYWYAQQYWPILEQYGCKVVDDAGKAAINAPAASRPSPRRGRSSSPTGSAGRASPLSIRSTRSRISARAGSR